MVATSWVWIGSRPTVNTPTNTVPTAPQASSLNNAGASGPFNPGPPRTGLQTVALDGTTPAGSPTQFRTTYQASPSTFTYIPPGETQARTATLTGYYNTQVTMTDSTGATYQVSGFIMQLSPRAGQTNGDLFFRPAASAVGPWNDGTRQLIGVSFANTTAPASTSNLLTTSFNPTIFAPCFAAGTLILTDQGERPVETLVPGDLVMTRDRGLQPVRWIASRRIDITTLVQFPERRPIRIKAGALGQSRPKVDLLVSPQHRVLVRSNVAQKMFGTDEILVAAKQLLQLDGIDVADDVSEVEYVHFLCDQHEVVISNGAETESLFTGPEALKSVGAAAREEIFALFPELRDLNYEPTPARTLVSGRMGRRLAVRHLHNQKALVRAS